MAADTKSICIVLAKKLAKYEKRLQTRNLRAMKTQKLDSHRSEENHDDSFGDSVQSDEEFEKNMKKMVKRRKTMLKKQKSKRKKDLL